VAEKKINGGWHVGRFIPVEIDVALTLATGYFMVSGMDEEFGELVAPLSGEWKQEATTYLGRQPRMVSIMEHATACIGTTYQDDYARAVVPVRSLDPADALDALRRQFSSDSEEMPDGGAGDWGQPDLQSLEISSTPGRDRAAISLQNAMVARQLAAYRRLGLPVLPDGPQARAVRLEAELLGRILKGGDLHDTFWHWLDRFFYQWYMPWRQTRESQMESARQRATMMLGAAGAESGAPPLDWLPPQNPIRTMPELRKAVTQKLMPLYFWVEPFGFADLSIIRTDSICVSFGEPGRIYTEFRKHAERVALRAKALGDPTRLEMLRLIRHFPLMNTELAAYLGIARPTASVHAKILREAGLISSRQEGHAVRHQIERGEIAALFEDLHRFLDLGETSGESSGRGKEE